MMLLELRNHAGFQSAVCSVRSSQIVSQEDGSGRVRQVCEYICEEDGYHDVGRIHEVYLPNGCWSLRPGNPNRTSCANQSLRLVCLLVANASCVTKRDCGRRRLHRSGCDDAAVWSKLKPLPEAKEPIAPAGSERPSPRATCSRQPRDDRSTFLDQPLRMSLLRRSQSISRFSSC